MTQREKDRIANMHRRKAENGKTFALILAYVQVIGRGIKEGKSFCTDDVRREIESNRTRYSRLDVKYLSAHLGNMTKSWIAQNKIKPTGKFVTSKYTYAPIRTYVGIDHSQDGIFLR